MTFPTGWARKCAITIDATQVAGSGTHSDFPVCLTVDNLPSEMLDKDGSYPAQMGGGDIRFSSDSAGASPLPCHVLEFITHNTPASGTALIYVGVDVSATADTTIYVWYSADTHKEQPKYNANPDADGFQGSDYVWTNYDIMLALGGFGGLRNLKQASASKNIGRYGNVQSKHYVVGERATGLDYIAWPSMVMLGERLYCETGATPQHAVDLDGSVNIWYSDDIGKTWVEDTALHLTDASFDLRDAKLFVDGTTLWLFYTKTNAADTTRVVHYRQATSPYTSWSSETTFTTQTKANSAGRVIALASGRIVAPCYHINGATGTCAPFVRWSDDGGSTWTDDYLTSDGAFSSWSDRTEFSVAEDPATPGNLVAVLRRNALPALYRLTSTDSGETWSSDASTLTLDGAADMPDLQYCQDGDLILAISKDRNSPEFVIRRSTDHGATWASDIAYLWENSGGSLGAPGGYTGQGGYINFVEVSKGLFAAAYYYDNGSTGPAKVWCTHFSKVEDGQLNAFTNTTKEIAGEVARGIELDDTSQWIGNASLGWFNQVHNGGAFTISGWAKLNQTSDELHCFAGNSAASSDRGFFFGYENRAVVSAPNALRLYKANGSGTAVDNMSASVSGDTSPHRWGVFANATSVPTFIKDATTYAGANAITASAGDAELGTRIGGVANGALDASVGRLDGWMEMWGFSSVNLGADYEATRYANESAPGTFAAAGTPASSAGATVPSLSSLTTTNITTTTATLGLTLAF